MPYLHRQGNSNSPLASISANPPVSTPSPTADSMAASGLLIKGLSTGLARRAAHSGSYSLRHTSSRLTRIKTQIFSEVLSTLNQQQQHERSTPVHQASCIRHHLQCRQPPPSSSLVALRPRRSVPLVPPPAASVAPVTRKRRPEGDERPEEEKKDEEILQKRRRFSERISARLAAAEKSEQGQPVHLPISASRRTLFVDNTFAIRSGYQLGIGTWQPTSVKGQILIKIHLPHCEIMIYQRSI